ncbi:14080_t:CDS:2 [Funneliformis caledonium]|uniref:14080_t:CDS:1 n=1 Tax=Funneliformis caledonium TaxID=1117310 RepID=A0A9N8ZPK3_9GLOM|nr:14080_t:CDS:2 [Funneliformis caledonium]
MSLLSQSPRVNTNGVDRHSPPLPHSPSLPSPPKNYSTYPQTTELTPSRDLDLEVDKPRDKGFLRFLYVIAPSIAQGAVTGSKLAFSSVNLTQLSEDDFMMSVSGEVTNTGPLQATIEVPGGVTVTWESLVIGQLPLDTIIAQPFVGAKIASSQKFKVLNKTAFAEFNKFMLREREFTWHLEGIASVKASGLSLQGIRLSKDVTMGGMQNFPLVTIDSFDAPAEHPDGGIEIEIVSTMGNPSPIGVQLGDLVFDVEYLGHIVGEVGAKGITLASGKNKLVLKGRLIPQKDAEKLAAVGDLFSKFITGKNATTGVIAKSVRPSNGSEPISWLQSAFEGTKLSVVLEGGKNLNIISSVDINALDLQFNAENQYTPLASSSSLTAGFSIPFGFPLEMKQISQEITMFDGDKELASLGSPFTAAKGDSKSGKIETSFDPIPFKVSSGSEETFDEFSKSLTLESSVTVKMKGVANSIAKTPVGDVEIKGIEFEVQSTLAGIQGLKTKPAVVNSLVVKGGTAENMLIELSVSLFNPSNVKIDMGGDVIFDLLFQEQFIGKVVMEKFVLERGENNAKVIAQFGPQGEEATKAGRELLNNFMVGKPNTVAIKGSTQSTTIAPLQKALAALELTTSMPGLKTEKPIIEEARFAIGFNTVFDSKGTASIDAFNPLDATIKFLKIQSSISVKGELIGVIDQDLSADPVVIPSKQTVTTKDFDLNLKISGAAIKSLFDSLAGKLKTDITSTILVAIGDFVTEIDYNQNGVQTGLGKGAAE